MVAKFLDLDREGHLHFQTMEEKYGLPFCSWEQSCTGRTIYMSFLCHVCRTSVYWDPEILPPWQRDVATSLSIRKETCFPLVRLLRFSLNKFNVIITRIIGVRTKHWPGVHGPHFGPGPYGPLSYGPGPRTPRHGPGSWTVFFFFSTMRNEQKQKKCKNEIKKNSNNNKQCSIDQWSLIVLTLV